jgi:hypothetical protein
MASKGVKKPSLRDLTRDLPPMEETEPLVKELVHGSDRVCALVAGALLDTLLGKCLEKRLTHLSETEKASLLYGQNALLSSFSAKIVFSYALQFITASQRKELNSIREIRNVFAHTLRNLDFNNTLIQSECLKLRTHDPLPYKFAVKNNNRLIFSNTTLVLYNEIGHETINYVKSLIT